MATAAVAAPVARQRAAAAGGEHLQYLPDPILVDVLWVERAAVSRRHPVVLFVGRIKHRLEKLHEAVGSAHVFRQIAEAL